MATVLEKTRHKRIHSSTSSASDTANSPISVGGGKSKQNVKKQKHDTKEEDMAVQKALEDIQRQLQNVATKDYMDSQMGKMATKEDISSMKDEVGKMVERLTKQIEKLEADNFEIRQKNDKLGCEIVKLRGENAELKNELTKSVKEITAVRRVQNDNEQHGRQWNIRVYGVGEGAGEGGRDETVKECVGKCVKVIKERVGVQVEEKDFEIAHRLGKRGGTRPRPIIARLFSRQVRGEVLANRRKLKGTGISIGEDLTQANYNLLKRVSAHSATLSSWSTNGKVWAMLKNGKKLRIDIDTNVTTTLNREM